MRRRRFMNDDEEAIRIRDAARELRGPEREAYLARACVGSPELVDVIRRELAVLDALPGAMAFEDDAARDVEELRRTLERLSRHSASDSRYEIGEPIEEGPGCADFGEVREVRDTDLDRPLVMRTLEKADREAARNDASRRRLRQFLDEARVTGQLDHPGIVPVHELGVDAHGGLYLTMRRVRGRGLRQIIELARSEAEGWNTARVLAVIERVCETLAYAHANGVVHRDVNPRNVVIGEFGEVYLMGWGHARAAGDERSLEEASDHSSAPAYTSPEQARGDRAGPRSDVYSVGAILYELCTGAGPYVRTGGDIGGSLLSGPPEDVGQYAHGAPSELLTITRRAMERSISQRFGDMQELLVALRAVSERTPGRDARAGVRAWAFSHHAATALLVAVVLLGLFVPSTFLWNERAAHARTRRELDSFVAAELVTASGNWDTMEPGDKTAWRARARSLLPRSERYESALETLLQRRGEDAAADPGGAREADELAHLLEDLERIRAVVDRP